MSRKEAAGVLVFFLLAFGIPWVGWTVFKDDGIQYWVLPLFVSIAAFVASYVEGGVDGLQSFSARTLHLKGTAKYIALGVCIPLTLGLVFLVGTGASLYPPQPHFKKGLGITLATAFVTGPLAEEFGWRGYLQAKLLDRMRPI